MSGKHPGQILLEGKQKRRTSEQKQADDAQAEQERLEQEAAHGHGIKRLANIIDESMREEESRLTNPPRPRPQPRVIVKGSVRSSVVPESPEDGGDVDGLDFEMVGKDGMDIEMTSDLLASSQGDGNMEVEGQEEDDDELKETLTQVVSKRKRSQKTSTRDAVFAAARGSSCGEINDQADRRTDSGSADGQKRKLASSHPDAGKNHYAGIGEIADWADKLSSSKPLHTLLSQHSTTNSRYARSVSSAGTGSQSKLHVTPASTHSSARPSTPTTNNPPVSETHDVSPYIQGSNNIERQAISLTRKAVHHRRDAMDITVIVSDSELDESEPSPPPVSRPYSRKGPVSASKAKGTQDDNYAKPSADSDEVDDEDVELATTTSRKGTKRAQRSRAGTSGSQSAAPPSKRMKMPKSSGNLQSGSGAHNKYTNSDLPLGATDDNAWQRLFISSLAHYTAGYDNPWSIPDNKFKDVLQEIWDTVYQDKVVYSVVVGGPVYRLARQGLNNWRAGFAAAAVAIITTFFAHDADFNDPMQRTDFAKAMLKKNRFLFSQNRGSDNKGWSGLWRAPFVLRTFTHHFNFIQGYVDVPALPHDIPGPRTVLALACTAVCRTLMLVAEENMTFKLTQPGNVWSAVIPKGSQFEFGEAVWGTMTRRYLEPIKELSDEQFGLILDDTQVFVKKVTVPAASTLDSAEDNEFDDLFAFR
ncbi:hypothetical protein BU15DRAFT_65844 [Melanogaster broomeanus]|nr:hypothetical protein BU15DRAFT_65844 [Melanogaster broomeanus]